jgi:hypothetical protein
MTRKTNAPEQELLEDLMRAPHLVENQNADDLYRALTNNVWRKGDERERAISLSWKEAEALVNRVREQLGHDPLQLAQTGAEGDVAKGVEKELRRLGWSREPLDTSRHEERHVEREESPPPSDAGERQSPVQDSRAWERQAHEEAERTRRGSDPAPATSSTGAGGGKGQPGKA